MSDEHCTPLNLTNYEIELIVEGLRISERLSREEFGYRMASQLGISPNNSVQAQFNDFTGIFDRFQRLREKLGDTKPVEPRKL